MGANWLEWGRTGANGGIYTVESAAFSRGVVATVRAGTVDLNAAVERAQTPLARAACVHSGP